MFNCMKSDGQLYVSPSVDQIALLTEGVLSLSAGFGEGFGNEDKFGNSGNGGMEGFGPEDSFEFN